ncbi:MAG TPA: condensation domain-containing protein [Thermoanaerobaculia bacterium]|nr:condensation domain-containing protein [Thermoanaerobaculia bacterium]
MSGPLSTAQEILWRLDRQVPGAALNIAAAVALDGPLDPAALEAAFHQTVARHEPLRSRYLRGREVEVLPSVPFGWERHDLAKLSAGRLAERLDRLVHRICSRPFRLAEGRPIRSALVRLPGERWAWLLALHHIAADGWGMVLWSRDLSAFYRSLVRGEPCRLDELEAQSLGYAAWQRGFEAGPAAAAQLAWWRGYLAGLFEEEIADPDEHDPYAPTALQTAALPDALTERVRAARVRERSSVFLLGLTAFALLLRRFRGREDLAVGTLVANRVRPESTDVLGAFYNTALLRLSLAGDPTVRELLARLGQTAQEVHERQGVPFGRVAAALAGDLAAVGNPPAGLLQVMFQHDEHPLRRLRLDGVTATDLDWSVDGLARGPEVAWTVTGPREAPLPGITRGRMARTADLSFHVREETDGLDLYLFYKMHRVADSTIRWLLASYREILAGVLDGLESGARVSAVAPGVGTDPPAATIESPAGLADLPPWGFSARHARALGKVSPAGA